MGAVVLVPADVIEVVLQARRFTTVSEPGQSYVKIKGKREQRLGEIVV